MQKLIFLTIMDVSDVMVVTILVGWDLGAKVWVGKSIFVCFGKNSHSQ
jgi:hypothetical protein